MHPRTLRLVAATLALSCSSTPPQANCHSPKVACGTACVDVTADDGNCGACGNACATTEACAAGSCLTKVCAKTSCSGVEVCVNDVCTDRACVGVTCSGNEGCVAGNCIPSQCQTTQCAPGFVCVNEACVDSSCTGVLCPLGGVCRAGVCQMGSTAATCSDGTKNGLETDVDCGGTCTAKCSDGHTCQGGADCTSARCVADTCIPQSGAGGGSGATGGGSGTTGGGSGTTGGGSGSTGGGTGGSSCNDGMKDGTETDTDCGGSCAAKCAVNQHCLTGMDCQQKVCATMTCAAPTCTDNQANGNESDVDCGGSCPNKCVTGQHCVIPADCTNNTCSAGTCGSSGFLCSDGMKDQDETDLDCGGATCLPCANAKACLLPRDCASGFCSAAVCGTGFAAAVGPGGGVLSTLAAASVNSSIDIFPDVAGVNTAGDTVSVFLGDGDGGFSAPLPITLPSAGWAFIDLEDMTGDGKADLLLHNVFPASPASFMVMKGNGNGTFQGSQTSPASIGNNQYGGRYVVAKLNADAFPDIAMMYFAGGPSAPTGVSILLGNGDGTFQPVSELVISGRTPMSSACTGIAVGDINGDGAAKLDLAIGCAPNQVWILLGNGDGTFAVASSVPLVAGVGQAITTVQVDNDTNLDVVAGMSDVAQVSILKGNGNGTFGNAISYATTATSSVATALDFNFDGHADVLLAHPGSLELLLGDGTGAFASGPTFPGSVTWMTVKDMNGDGKPDLLSCGSGGGFALRLHK
jgi:hypothetical protein